MCIHRRQGNQFDIPAQQPRDAQRRRHLLRIDHQGIAAEGDRVPAALQAQCRTMGDMPVEGRDGLLVQVIQHEAPPEVSFGPLLKLDADPLLLSVALIQAVRGDIGFNNPPALQQRQMGGLQGGPCRKHKPACRGQQVRGQDHSFGQIININKRQNNTLSLFSVQLRSRPIGARPFPALHSKAAKEIRHPLSQPHAGGGKTLTQS